MDLTWYQRHRNQLQRKGNELVDPDHTYSRRSELKTDTTDLNTYLNTDLNTEDTKPIRTNRLKIRKTTVHTEEDTKSQELRQELKLLVLKNAELNGSSEAELKRDLNKVARVKSNDLPFELDRARLITSKSWTRDLPKSVMEQVWHLMLYFVAKGP